MKNHIQTIVNVCLAICVTLLIYQNNQQKDQIETANWFAQHSVDQSWDRMDRIEAEQTRIADRVGIAPAEVNKFGDTPVYWTVNERLTSYGLVVVENQSRLDTNETNIKTLIEVTNNIEDYLAENFGNN